MPSILKFKSTKNQVSIMDVLLYLLAGSAMTMISVSFLLWLRF